MRSLVVIINENRNITLTCIPTVREQGKLCFSGCKTSLFCLKYVQILWNSTLTNSINSSKFGPEASNVVSSAKRKSLSKEFSGRSLMYNKSIYSLFFTFFCFFSLNFRFTSIFSLNFRLFYLRFRFRFLVFRIEVNPVKLGFFFASKRNEIFASISNFASEAKVRAHPTLNCDGALSRGKIE